MYIINESGNVYFTDEKMERHIGTVEKVETNRINNNEVEDVSYLFDLELGDYVEQSRAVRVEPLPTPAPTELDMIGIQLVQLDLRLLEGGL